MHKLIYIKSLSINDARTLSELLSIDKDYSRYFNPFSFDPDTIERILGSLQDDKFFGVFIDNELVGFYMLRGFDEGYEIPSYGVWISKNCSDLGLSKLTLQHALSFCKVNRIKKIMLKVHPENLKARHIYESFGFEYKGMDNKNDNLVYYKKLF